MTAVRPCELVSRITALSRRLTAGTLLICAVSPVGRSLVAQTPQHPLDPLTAEEHLAMVQILRAAGRTDSTDVRNEILSRNPK